jgi:ribosome biogenesis GTPase
MKKYRVISVTSQKAVVENEKLEQFDCFLKGKYRQKFKRNLNFLRVGDFVEVKKQENEFVIEKVLPRKTKLSRSMPNYSHKEQIIAANIDQIFMINAFVNPMFKYGLIDRYTVLAEKNDLPMILVFNKADLIEGIDVDEIIEMYENIGYSVLVTSTKTGEGLDEFRELLENKISVLTGHSGVGKSSLLNTIMPELELDTFEVSDYNEKGQHTTSLSVFYRMNEETAVIDTPGIREFGIWNIEPEDLHMFFREFHEIRENCKFYNCTHRHEPKCAVREAVDLGEIDESRYQNYLYIFEELEEKKKDRY